MQDAAFGANLRPHQDFRRNSVLFGMGEHHPERDGQAGHAGLPELQGLCPSVQVLAAETLPTEAAEVPAPTRGGDDLAVLIYTSGTTGHPKGAIITHGMVFWNCVNLGIPALISPQTVQLVVLPLFHTGGLNCYANPVLHAGGTILIMRTFDPGQALDYISDPALGITHFFGVPAPYQFMMQHPKLDRKSTRLNSSHVSESRMPSSA